MVNSDKCINPCKHLYKNIESSPLHLDSQVSYNKNFLISPQNIFYFNEFPINGIFIYHVSFCIWLLLIHIMLFFLISIQVVCNKMYSFVLICKSSATLHLNQCTPHSSLQVFSLFYPCILLLHML